MFDVNFQTQTTLTYNQSASIHGALNLFEQARQKAERSRVATKLLRRQAGLHDLTEVPTNDVFTRRHGGVRPVNICCICGTLGRATDFDEHFMPLSDRARGRWVSVLNARRQGIPLPPVELIQVGECYFVKDGHHRISVARALGETVIDAEVTVWDIPSWPIDQGKSRSGDRTQLPMWQMNWFISLDRIQSTRTGDKNMNSHEITLSLARIPLFHSLTNRQLQNVAQLAVVREYTEGTSIVTQGESGIGLFVILEGQADAIRTHADNSRVVVNTFGPNDFFGEMALLDEGSRTASVVATQPTRCLVLARWDFMSLLKTDSEMVVDILTEMARRFRTMLEAS